MLNHKLNCGLPNNLYAVIRISLNCNLFPHLSGVQKHYGALGRDLCANKILKKQLRNQARS